MVEIKQTQPIPIASLNFDPQNPRIPSSIDSTNNDAVINWMLKSANLLELMGSIAEKGFFPAEPLLVIPISEGQDEYYVVEGNRRFAALYLLNNLAEIKTKKSAVEELIKLAADHKHDLQNIPVLIYDVRDEIEEYLGYRHITGVKPWSPIAKAKYLKQLQSSVSDLPKDEQYRSLARTIGSKSNHVRLLLVGLEVAEQINEQKYYNVENLDDTTLDFGVLYTALAKSNISDYVGVNLNAQKPTENLDPEKLGDLVHWMFERNEKGKTKLGESRNLSDLDEVVASEEALLEFKKGASLSESLKLSDDPHEAFLDSLESADSELKRAINILDYVDSDNLEEDFSVAKRISKTLEVVIEKLKSKL
ncbi:ParB/Srx family N-terminal domain-containing protein [uncultured Psychroserpens sp.]|uniref:ParB/Srx family N-terminal domain-containing protein n=1 Tax=uncultured Psychroserpens sp. TaxID=255436 RepID=UPI0026202671|nr:ParB/Srx family N-terminal domain-containing protein [uncultured Psychroserpens sp.]